MSITNWIQERREIRIQNKKEYRYAEPDPERVLWVRCDRCGTMSFIRHLRCELSVCPKCDFNYQMTSYDRLDFLIDPAENLNPDALSSFLKLENFTNCVDIFSKKGNHVIPNLVNPSKNLSDGQEISETLLDRFLHLNFLRSKELSENLTSDITTLFEKTPKKTDFVFFLTDYKTEKSEKDSLFFIKLKNNKSLYFDDFLLPFIPDSTDVGIKDQGNKLLLLDKSSTVDENKTLVNPKPTKNQSKVTDKDTMKLPRKYEVRCGKKKVIKKKVVRNKSKNQPLSLKVPKDLGLEGVYGWRPFDDMLSPCDPLEFIDKKSYPDRLDEIQTTTGLQDAIQTGTGFLDGIPVAMGIMDFRFIAGSLSSVVGEKITRLIEYATTEGLTLVLVSASGGARMQEGVLGLMQMAKISAALQVYHSSNLLYISLITSPTAGGVTASFAMLGDITLAEPEAVIAFAGLRVMEQIDPFIREKIPPGFQTAEYLFERGFVDVILSRRFLKAVTYECILLHTQAPLRRKGFMYQGVQNNITFFAENKEKSKWKNYKELVYSPYGL